MSENKNPYHANGNNPMDEVREIMWYTYYLQCKALNEACVRNARKIKRLKVRAMLAEKALREIASQPPHTMDCAGIARRALEGTDEE